MRARCRAKWGTLASVEVLKAKIEYLALNADQTITRVGVDDQNPRGEGTFDVYLATDTGPASGAAVTAVQNVLDPLFFQSNAADANASAADPLAITATLYYDPAYDATDVQTAVETALLAWFASIPLGGFNYGAGAGLAHVVRLEDVQDALKSATIGDVKVIKSLSVTVPASYTTIADFDVVTQGSHTLTYTAASE